MGGELKNKVESHQTPLFENVFTPMIEFLVHRYLWFSKIDFQYTHKRER